MPVDYLRDRLAEMRREYTGQPMNLARIDVMRALGNLTSQEREDTARELDCGEPISLDRARSELLPDACTAEQRWLESAVFARFDSMNKLVDKMSTPFNWVSPQETHVSVRLRGPATLPFLLTVMPRMVGDTLSGIPGLRLKPMRRSMKIYLIDQSDTAVYLANIPNHLWNQLASDLIEVTGDVNVFRLWGPPIGGAGLLSEHEPHPLAEAEIAARACLPLESEEDAVASALLRRSGLTWGTGMWRRDGARFTVDVPNPTDVGDALCDPLFGIPYRVVECGNRVQVTTEWEGWE